DLVIEKVNEIRKHTTIPVGVGFGIRDADSAKRISAVADAVVVGSAVVQRVADNAGDAKKISAAVCELLSSMRKAMDASK
ncbi:MAG: tryptophan synthase alpha chain, partial [Pseudomonadota bacterium]|nr:tryptophan synthase alpha chain [Pseudomonadota bacterium]